MKHKIITFSLLVAALFTVLFAALCTSCKTNSRGFPIIWFMHNGTSVQKTKKIDVESKLTNEYPLAIKIAARDGTNFLGVYMGMIAEWDGQTSRYHPPTNYIGGPTGLSFADQGWMESNAHPQGVMMFSATSGELLKWISYEDFRDIFVLKTKPEYK